MVYVYQTTEILKVKESHSGVLLIEWVPFDCNNMFAKQSG